MRSVIAVVALTLMTPGCQNNRPFEQQPINPATAIQEALSLAYLDFEVIGACSEGTGPSHQQSGSAPNKAWNELYNQGLSDYYQVYESIEGLIGSDADVTALVVTSTSSGRLICSARVIEETNFNARARLARAADLIRPIQTQTSRGLWVGEFPLCMDTVAAISQGVSDFGTPALSVTLKPEIADQFRSYTSRFVERVLLVRLNSVDMSKPRVLEPLGGSLTISGLPAAAIPLAIQAARSECPGPLPAPR